MATALAPSFYEIVRLHAEQGVALNEMTLSEDQRLRIQVCMNTWQRLQENPGMSIERYLQKTWKRTYSEIANDRLVVNFLAKLLGHEEKALVDFRARKHAERFMDMAASQGDVKNGVAALGMYQKITHAGEEEKGLDVGKNTAILQPIFVPITAIDKSKQQYDTKAMRKIRRKYGATTDAIQDLIEDKEGVYEAMDTAEMQRQQTKEEYQERINAALDAGDYELAGKLRTEMRNNDIAASKAALRTQEPEDDAIVVEEESETEDERLSGIMQNYFGEDDDEEDTE